MLLSHNTKKKYNAGISFKESQQTYNLKDSDEVYKLLNNFSIMEESFGVKRGLYEIVSDDHIKSYIFISSKSDKNNMFHMPTDVLDILLQSDNITFYYEPGLVLDSTIRKNFKSLIDSSLSLIDLVQKVLIDFSSCTNFDLYLSLVTKLLDMNYNLIDSYNKIFKVKTNLGKNLAFVLVSPDKLGFGMIDPEGCLINSDDNFDFKNISFKPIVETNSFIFPESACSHDNRFNVINEYTDKSKWIGKLVSNPNSFFIMDNDCFEGSGNVKKDLEKLGYTVNKIKGIK